jgi:hypothetical protein
MRSRRGVGACIALWMLCLPSWLQRRPPCPAGRRRSPPKPHCARCSPGRQLSPLSRAASPNARRARARRRACAAPIRRTDRRHTDRLRAPLTPPDSPGAASRWPLPCPSACWATPASRSRSWALAPRRWAASSRWACPGSPPAIGCGHAALPLPTAPPGAPAPSWRARQPPKRREGSPRPLAQRRRPRRAPWCRRRRRRPPPAANQRGRGRGRGARGLQAGHQLLRHLALLRRHALGAGACWEHRPAPPAAAPGWCRRAGSACWCCCRWRSAEQCSRRCTALRPSAPASPCRRCQAAPPPPARPGRARPPPLRPATRAGPAQVLGRGLKDLPRDQIVVSTKVGRYGQETFDFSAERVTASVHESLARLQVGPGGLGLTGCAGLRAVQLAAPVPAGPRACPQLASTCFPPPCPAPPARCPTSTSSSATTSSSGTWTRCAVAE